MTRELVVILTSNAYNAVGGKHAITSCNRLFINNDRNAVALWWNGRPLTPYQVKQSAAFLREIDRNKLDCSEYLILRIGENEEPESIGCFHDHPFNVKQVVTFEVTDAH